MQSEMPKKTPFDIAAVPHFLREGHAVRDFMNPDRVIIGAESQKALDILVDIFRPLNAPMLITDINSAELIKHATNAFLATKISFINSIAHICEKTGADINVVAKGLGLDRRIGQEYLNAGIGYGGIFFPKDINSLVNIADEYHINLDLLKTTETINRYQRLKFIEKIEQALGSNGSASPEGQTLEGKTLAIWGLAYRPNTDDMRNAPSINIIRSLQQRGAKIRAYDPLTMGVAKASLPGVTFCEDAYDAAKGTDLIAILTEWDEFQTLNFQKLKETSQCRTIVDGRNLFNPVRMGTLGFRYISMGRPEGKPAGSIKVKAAALS
jgi:UDPglucose 6-dehydrogenase